MVEAWALPLLVTQFRRMKNQQNVELVQSLLRIHAAILRDLLN